MQTFGYAALQIIPSMKGATKILDDELNGAAQKSAGTKTGSTIGSKIGSGLKKASKVGAVAAAGLIGTALVKGFGRLKAVDDATASLRGLGYTGGEISGIMDTVSKSVEGTTFLVGDTAKVAATALASGVKPGDDLQRTLSIIGDSASFAGTSMGDMGGIFNKVAASNKVQGDTIAQLQNQGIPIVQLMADELGVTADEVYKMSSAGEIGFDTFRNAMETGMGGAAQEQAKTFTGALSNAGAALGRFGESLLAGIFPQLAPLLEQTIDWLDALGPMAEPLGEMLGQAFAAAVEGIMDFIDWLGDAGDFLNEHKGTIGAIAAAITGVLAPALVVAGVQWTVMKAKAVGAWVATQAAAVKSAAIQVLNLYKTAGAWAAASARAVASGAIQVAQWTMMGAAAVRNAALAVGAAVQTAAAWVANTARMVAAFVAQRVAMAANLAIMVAQRAAAVAQAAVMGIVRGATMAWTAAQWLLNAAMTANPIGLIIAAIVAFVAIIVIAWNKVDWFREGILAAWDWIKTASAAVWDWLKDLISGVWDAIVFYFQNLNPVGIIITHWDQIKEFTVTTWNAVLDFITGIWNSLVGWVTTKVNQMKTGLQAAWTAIKTGATNIWNGLVTAVTNLIVGWVATITNRINQLKTKALAIWTALRSSATSIWNGLVNGVKNIVSGMVTTVVNKVNQIKSRAIGAWNALRSQTASIFNRVKTAITSPISSAVSVVQQIPGRIQAVFSGAASWLVNSGRSIIQGFINGIKGMIGSAVNAAKNVVGKVRDFFPFSPAKKGPFSGRGWVEYSGRSIGEGFADGILANVRVVESAADKIANAATIDAPGPRVGSPQVEDLRSRAGFEARARGPYMSSLRPDYAEAEAEQRRVEITQYVSTQDPEAAAQRSGRLITAGLR